MNIRKNLEMSLRVETLAETIYLTLSELFPEARALFERLSCEESRHADIVAINMKLLDIDQLPAELAVDIAPPNQTDYQYRQDAREQDKEKKTNPAGGCQQDLLGRRRHVV